MRAKTTLCLASAGALVVALASAQRFAPRRPQTRIVGAPSGPAPAERVDALRDALSPVPLPSGTLRVAWRRSLGLTLDHAPLVDASGDVTLVTSRGDVVVLDAEGNERTHTAVGASAVSAGARLSDGTIVFVTGAAEVVGVKLGAVRFRTRMSGDRASVGAKLAPLPLDDGGFVASSGSEVATFDAEGNVRARAAFGEPLHGPVLTGMGRVLVVTATGAVHGWAPGREPARIGTFGGLVDGGAAFDGRHTLLAVVDETQLVADLARGVARPVASAASAGVLALAGPPAVRGATATVLGLAAARTFVLTFDATGQEVARQAVTGGAAAPGVDGGGAATFPPHVGPLVDAAGVVAFAAPDGQVGAVSATGGLDVLGDPICARIGPASSAALPSLRNPGVFAGLAPAGPRAFIVGCESGVVAEVVSGDGGAPP